MSFRFQGPTKHSIKHFNEKAYQSWRSKDQYKLYILYCISFSCWESSTKNSQTLNRKFIEKKSVKIDLGNSICGRVYLRIVSPFFSYTDFKVSVFKCELVQRKRQEHQIITILLLDSRLWGFGNQSKRRLLVHTHQLQSLALSLKPCVELPVISPWLFLQLFCS